MLEYLKPEIEIILFRENGNCMTSDVVGTSGEIKDTDIGNDIFDDKWGDNV